MKKHLTGKMVLLMTAFLFIFIILLRQFLVSVREEQAWNGQSSVTSSQTVAGERITRAEAYRMFSFFFYTGEEREKLDWVVSSDIENEWYATYKNAMANAGLFEIGKVADELDPYGNLTCEEMKELLVLLSDKAVISYADIVQKLPERLRTAKAEDEVLLKEFLQLYDVCSSMVADKDDQNDAVMPMRLEQGTFFVLNTINSDETGKITFITEDGAVYQAGKFQDYTDIYQMDPTNNPQDFVLENEEFRAYPDASDYLDEQISVIFCGSEIVYIQKTDTSDVILYNAWILSCDNDILLAYINGQTRQFKVGNTSFDVSGVVGNLTIQKKEVIQLDTKTDIINGKVLMTSSQAIEIEGYGRLTLDENYKIYKIYDEIEMERTNSILVGYSITDFVVEDGKIVAALIKEKLKADNIRVLISLDATSNYYHEEITITSDTAFTLVQGEEVTNYKEDDIVILTLEDFLDNEERIRIEPVSENGKLTVTSISRSYGIPSYRGVLEISSSVEGLLLINELSLEEYLYSVVPSEMPTSYGEEAAKVQAVCARSYAYKQLLSGRYSSYGANVDDTVNCQVYNNVLENDTSIFAVKDTYGQVLSYNGDIITAYYFSTSCGVTSNIEDVWTDASSTEYFSAKLQLDDVSYARVQEAMNTKYSQEDSAEIKLSQEPDTIYADLSDETAFQTFINENSLLLSKNDLQTVVPVTTWDSSYGWYRWYVTLDTYAISKQIDETLNARYQANSSYIQTFVSGDGTYTTPSGSVLKGRFVSIPVSTVGRVTKMEIVKRSESGIITELLITGTKNTILVKYQMNIRTLLAPVSTNLYLAGDSVLEGFSLMPSAYFYFEPIMANGTVTGYTFYGGGYGHGVGMSQNGVKALMQAGYNYEEIVKYYYTGIELGFIYQ